MASYNAPRKGSMAFYPRVRSKKETPSMKASGKENKALSFLAYKVGMTQVMGKNTHKGSPGFGQDVFLPATIVECPPLKVLGVRAYVKDEIGVNVLGDVLVDSFDKELKRKIIRFKEKTSKKTKKEEPKTTIADFEAKLDKILYFTLIVYTQPKVTTIKKKPDTVEINIGGTKEEQLAYAKEKIGKEIMIEETFEEGTFLDIKAVTIGKGFQGVIKRFGVKIQRPKAKTRRVVGSISPWNPSTVMFTVARPGQMGYHNRTEHNKKILKISDDIKEVNGKSGYSGYGLVKGKYMVIAGSIPGPSKRCIAIRKSQRPAKKSGAQITGVEKILVN
jgi:large subunit ribosomal protein L3